MFLFDLDVIGPQVYYTTPSGQPVVVQQPQVYQTPVGTATQVIVTDQSGVQHIQQVSIITHSIIINNYFCFSICNLILKITYFSIKSIVVDSKINSEVHRNWELLYFNMG